MPHSNSSAPQSAGPEPAAAAGDTRAYEGGSGELGVLLCHGFTGSPASLRPWADHLVAEGFRVRLPLLPGHGTSWEQLNETSWTDWYAMVETSFRLLRQECRTVFVAGLSMGGCLALRLAERYGDDVAGLVLVNPAVNSSNPALKAVPLLRRLIPSMKGITNDIARGGDEGGYDRMPLTALGSMAEMWRNVRQNLDRVDQPVLLFRSATDHVVDPSSAKAIVAGINSHDVTVRTLERSYHVATLDYDAPTIFAESVQFFRAHDPRQKATDAGEAGDG